MSVKLKFTFGILAIIAGFLILRLGLFFKNTTQTAMTANLSNQVTPTREENPLAKDNDGDGLSDRDEIIYGTNPQNKDTDGDGYLDGEEIATGYDPLDPSSNSKSGLKSSSLISSSANLTDRLLNLSMASTVNDLGNFDPTQITTKQYGDIYQSISNEAAISLFVPPISDSDIKIINDNSVTAVQKYLKSISVIIEEGLLSFTSGVASGIEGVINPSSSYPGYYQATYDSLKVIEVPSSWKELHKAVLLDFLQLSVYFKALQKTDEDPVKASFALSQVQDSFLQLLNLLNRATQLAGSQHVPIQDSILNMIQSANNVLPSSK